MPNITDPITLPAMDAESIAKRLVRAYERTTDTERAAGIAWYRRANDVVHALATDYGVDVPTVARVIAVLSPNNRWQSNLLGAETALRFHGLGYAPQSAFGRCGTYNVNVTKAWRIMDGDPSALSGPKVTAFAANLMGDTDYLTLDSWAVRIAIGWTRARNFRDGSGVQSPGRYRSAIDRGYRMAAARVGLPVAHLQAILWVHVRGDSE